MMTVFMSDGTTAHTPPHLMSCATGILVSAIAAAISPANGLTASSGTILTEEVTDTMHLRTHHSALMAVILASIGLFASEARAQATPPAPSVEIDLVTRKALSAAVGPTFDAGQIDMLHSVAHQQVVTLVCRGFKVDPTRFEREMNLIYYDEKGQQVALSSEQLHEREKQAMVGFGIVLGAQIAIATLDTKGFCEHAREEAAAADLPHRIWAK
jgi:hypothetical protein